MSRNIVDLADEPEHAPLLASWHHQEWSYLNPGFSLEQRLERMRQYLQPALVPSTFVCKEGDQVMGSATIVESDMDTHPELSPWLASVFVSPAARNQGVGSALVKRVMETAAQNGIETLYLFTDDQARFYQSLGWSVFQKESYRDCDVTIMSVDLTQ